MNGFEFVNEALSIRRYELDAIIELTGGLEVDWLEFKAAIKPQHFQEAAASNEADYIFNLVKALISMANGAGGMVVLGINDHGEAVGLDKSGFDGDKDKFTRYISEKVFFRDGWRTHSSGNWRWKNTSDQIAFSPQWAKYQGLNVLAFTVHPRDAALGPLALIHSTNKNAEQKDVVLVRSGGDRGKIVSLSSEKAIDWWMQRDLTLFGTKFKTWITELQKTEPEVYLATVGAYCREFVIETTEVEQFYVPLEADVRIDNDASAERRYRRDQNYLSSESLNKKTLEWRGEAQEIIRNISTAFLIGETGAGKSTSLLKLARDINIANLNDPDEWALYVPLSGFTAAGLRDLICREIPTLRWPDIKLGLESFKLTLILDGLNECPVPHYEFCTTEISDLFKEHQQSKIIVSTVSSQLPGFVRNTIQLRSMSKMRQQRFLAAYFGHNREAVESFWSALSQKPTAQMIAKSPILLRISISVWKETGVLPGGLAELYGSFFDAWIRREIAKDLTSGSTIIWKEDQIREALALLAYSMRRDGIVTCSPESAANRIQLSLGDQASSFIERFTQGLILERNPHSLAIRFRHETIQEFLVAVFLTGHSEHRLLEKNRQFDSRRWSMPIVFAFELFERPPEHFLHTAWQIAPLLVCAALRDQERLALLPEPIGRHFESQNDHWVRGVIRCMRGESVAEATRTISYLGRTPSPGRYFQKHPLPEELTSALEGGAFWYALTSHEDGRNRIERLQHLVIDRRNLWLELLPHVIVGQPEWLIHLSKAQKLLVRELDDHEREVALGEASVVELCYMARNQIITNDEFRTQWRRALNVENTEPLELEILALLAAKEIRANQFNGAQRSVLKNIGNNLDLSPRILHVLVRDKIIQADEIRRDPLQIRRLADTVSPIRAKQLINSRVLRRTDFDERQLRSLFDRIETEKDIGFVLDAGLAEGRQQIPRSIRDRVHGYGRTPRDNEIAQPIDRPERDEVEKDTTIIISEIYFSQEQMKLKTISQEIQDPNNFPPGNGYHRVLAEQIESSKKWPITEREILVNLAEKFFLDHASKKRQGEYRDLIRSARHAVEIDKSDKVET